MRTARPGAVLVGHSMGGVVARLLCVDSGEALWNAAFLVPPESLDASAKTWTWSNGSSSSVPIPALRAPCSWPRRIAAAPAPLVCWATLTRDLVGRRAIEVHALRRIATSNPDAIRPELRDVFQQG